MPSRIFPGRPEKPDWNRMECLERNRYPRHAYLVQFPDQVTCEQAQENNRRYLSPFVLMQTGTWDYKWFDSILQLPENIFSYRSGFDRIEVPSSRPAISVHPGTDKGWPFPVDPPHVPEHQPVAVYHRSIQLPKTWNGLRKKLVLQGASSACHVVLNGKLVGYAQNARQMHEFEVSSLVHDGQNELFILVYPYHASSYLDGHCQLNRSGLGGDVYFEAIPPASVFDLSLHTRMNQTSGQWELLAEATVLTFKITQDLPLVRFELIREGQVVQEQVVKPEKYQPTEITIEQKVQQSGLAKVHWPLPEISPWSDEQPDLYDLYITCLDANGREISCVHQSVGFCERTVREGQFYLNHQPVFLNLADYDPIDSQTGLMRPLASLARDLRLVKQHSNAIRLTCGPVDPVFFELCNHLGLLVLANLTAQPVQEWLQAKDSFSQSPWLTKPWQMVQQDRLESQTILLKNNVCILAWPVAEQDLDTPDSMCSFAKRLDPSRPSILFVQAVNNEIDTVSQENGLGSVIQILDPGSGLEGGGIHPVLQSLPDLRRQVGLSGVILGAWTDVRQQAHSHHGRTQAVALSAIRQANRPVGIEPIDIEQGEFLLTNQTRTLKLDLYRLHWQIVANGQLVIAGEIDLPPLLPGETDRLVIPYAQINRPQGLPYRLHLTVHLIEANWWYPADHILSTDSFELDASSNKDPDVAPWIPAINSGRNRLRLEKDRHFLVVSGHRFWLVFNKITAQIESWRCKDHEYLVFPQLDVHLAPSAIVFWRPPFAQDQSWSDAWQALGLDGLEQIVDHVEADCDGDTVQIVADCRFGSAGRRPFLSARMKYSIHENGSVDYHVAVSCRRQEALNEFPRIGFRLLLRHQYERFIWSGQGPGPSWPDLRGLYYEGQFEQPLAEVMPDKGHSLHPELPHAGTKWLIVADSSGNGLQFQSNQRFSFCASDRLPAQTAKSGHETRLVHQPMIDLKIDWHYKPSGGQPEIEIHREIFAETQNAVEYSLTMTPVTAL